MSLKRIDELKIKLVELLHTERVPYLGLTESMLPTDAGVYLISANINNQHIPYYVGRASNLGRRLYTNHLMGNESTARLKKYMIEAGEFSDMSSAKDFIRAFCSVQWILENNYRNRGAFEGFFTGVIFPKYGISPE